MANTSGYMVYGNFKCYIFHFNDYLGLTIEIILDGAITSQIYFCIGEILTLICRNDTAIYAWYVPPIVSAIELQVSRGIPRYTKKNLT